MGTIDTIRRDETSASVLIRRARTEYLRKLVVAVVSASGWFEKRLERRRSRHALLGLTDEQLKDIGISRAEADGEARRRFWD
jgi:uncharacterized protein YjiS (DUF1127 family)